MNILDQISYKWIFCLSPLKSLHWHEITHTIQYVEVVARFQGECGHGIGIIWHQRRCKSSTRSATCRDTCTCADKPWCNGHQDSCSVAHCTSGLISDAGRLFATCGRLLTRDTHTCMCLYELRWPSLVTRHPPQSSERVLIFLAAKWSQYRDHTQVSFLMCAVVVLWSLLWFWIRRPLGFEWG